MDNYEYLIAGLPVLQRDWSANTGLSVPTLIEEIRGLCSKKDNALIDEFLKGYDGENLNEEFYTAMLKHRDPFIREFYRFDLNLKNAKVKYINDSLGRAEGTDIFMEDDGEFEESEEIKKILYGENLLERESGLDSAVWNKVNELNSFDYFNIDAVLGFIAKLKIIDRWMSLDEGTGKEMFRKLVDEIRGTFKGVEFNDKQN
ncbi:MAG: DUF2764 family protein [Bacteroidia bacterium]|nr:DUF2764 family protein [Bacteroidia bacterium]